MIRAVTRNFWLPTSTVTAIAFTKIVERRASFVWSVALKITGNPTDAADAYQESFLAAHRAATSFKGDAAFSTWLYRITVNAALSQRRKKQKITGASGDYGRRVCIGAGGTERSPSRSRWMSVLTYRKHCRVFRKTNSGRLFSWICSATPKWKLRRCCRFQKAP